MITIKKLLIKRSSRDYHGALGSVCEKKSRKVADASLRQVSNSVMAVTIFLFEITVYLRGY